MIKSMIFEYSDGELEALCKKDAALAAYIAKTGRIVRAVTPDVFEALIRGIVSQQISNAAFATVWQRFFNLAGEITPRSVAAISRDQLRRCGMSGMKADYILGAANSVLSGKIALDGLCLMSDEDVIKTLTALSGVGRWTAEMLLIFSLGRKDVFSAGDFGLRRGAGILYSLGQNAGKEFMDELAARYSPLGSVASFYLWKLSEETGK